MQIPQSHIPIDSESNHLDSDPKPIGKATDQKTVDNNCQFSHLDSESDPFIEIPIHQIHEDLALTSPGSVALGKMVKASQTSISSSPKDK